MLKDKMNMKNPFCIIALSIFLLTQINFEQAVNETLKKQAEESGQAFVSGDFNKLVDLTYPKLVELLGGRAKMVAFLQNGTREMRAQGAEVLSMSATDPIQVTTIGRQLFAVVPVTLKVKVPVGIAVSKSFMVGISSDRGRSWTFVDGSYLDEQRMRILFPTAVGKLKFPPEEKPTLYRAQ